MRGSVSPSLAIALAAITAAVAAAGAQEVPGHPWAFSVYNGTAPTATGGGVGPLMHAPELLGASFKVRLGHRPWWVGVDYEGWTARPTLAGLDTIIVETGEPLPRERGGEFGVDVVSISLRHDMWTFRRLAAYEIATIGKAWSSGTIYGDGCSFDGCAIPKTAVNYPGRHFAASVGWGMLARLPEIPPPWSYLFRLPPNVHVEARVASVGTRHGRILSAPLMVGVTW